MANGESKLSELAQLDQAHVLHPLVSFRGHERTGPTVIVGGEGIRVKTEDGRTFIDGLSGLFNINVGHGRTEIADAVAAQMKTQAYYPSFWGYTTEPAVRLATRLAGLLADHTDIDHFLFTTGGSDANELAFRYARFYHAVQGRESRRKILSRRHAYHGATRAAGSATRLPVYHMLDEPDPLHHEVDSPYCLRCQKGLSFPGCGLACADDLASVLEREGPDTVAAVIVEPVQGTGGIISPPEGYFDRLQEICRKHDVLIIADEVITGFGRTGRWFGSEHFNLKPDIMCFAKGLTSGYLPLGAVGVDSRVYGVMRDEAPRGLPFMAGLTYNNHPAGCAAGMANLDIVEREGLVENSAVQGAYLRQQLAKTFGQHPMVAEVRGRGMLAAMELTAPGTIDPAGGTPGALPAAIAKACLRRGLIVRALWECIALAPPLITTAAEIDEIVGLLDEAWQEVVPQFS